MLPDRDIHGVETLWQPFGPIDVVSLGDVEVPPTLPARARRRVGNRRCPLALLRPGPVLRRAGGGRRGARGRRPAALWQPLRRPRARGPGRAPGGRRPGDAGHRGHLHRLRGGHRGGPALALRHHPPGHPLRRVAAHRGGPGPAAQRPQPVHRRRVPRPALRSAPGVVPSELVTGSPNFRRECVGVDPPGGIWAHICGSDLIRDADGTVLRAGGQPAGPVGRLLPAREPDGGQARLPRDVPPLQHRAGRPLHRAAGQPAGLGVPVDRRPHHRGADPGDLQLGLLRARLSGPAARRGAGRGQRPGGAGRRLRLRPDHRRAPAGRRHLPPDRRPLPRSRGLPCPTRCSGCPG